MLIEQQLLCSCQNGYWFMVYKLCNSLLIPRGMIAPQFLNYRAEKMHVKHSHCLYSPVQLLCQIKLEFRKGVSVLRKVKENKYFVH